MGFWYVYSNVHNLCYHYCFPCSFCLGILPKQKNNEIHNFIYSIIYSYDYYSSNSFKFDNLKQSPNYFHLLEKQEIELSRLGSSNIALCPGTYIERIITSENELPSLNKERAMQFSRKKECLDVPSWYTHTPGSNGFDVFLYMRNFAILFNNLGLDELKRA